MKQQAGELDKNMDRFWHGWRQEVGIANKYNAYQKRYMDMDSKFHQILGGHLGRTTTTKHQIELPKPNTRSVQAATYSAGPKTCKFEKTQIDELLKESIIEPAHTE